MVEVLTEEELLFCETFIDPVAFSETLFPNFDNFGEYDEEKFGHVRNGQLPLLSYEYLIDEDPDKTEKENFRLLEGAGNIWCFGGRNFGKCEYEENYCTLSNGSKVKFKDLKGKHFEVIAFDEKDWKLKPAKAYAEDNGIRECYKLHLITGKETIVTENHKFFTQEGWKRIVDIKKGDFVAVPRILRRFKATKKVEKQVAILLGYLLGDGGCHSGNGISFTNVDEELINEVCELASYFDCKLNKRKITYHFVRKEQKYGVRNKVNELAKKYKIKELSKNKRMPKEVFIWPKKSIALLLNRLFACDGYVNRNTGSIEITLASKELIYDIRHLLLFFGIKSYVSFKKAKYRDKEFNSWRLRITVDSDKFLDLIGVKSKDFGARKNKSFSTSDRIPREFIKKLYSDFKGRIKECSKKINIGLRKMKIFDSSRLKWQKIAKFFKDNKELQKIAYSDIEWVKVKNVENVGELPTVAVEVDKYHTYISNEIISHNTECVLKLDMLMSLILHDGWQMLVTSYDSVHIRGVVEPVIGALEYHPILSSFKERIKRSPSFLLTTSTKNTLEGINMNLKGSDPGSNFFQKHAKKIFGEEMSFETDEVFNKRIDSKSELGWIERMSGMTNFTENMPAGRIYFQGKKPWVLNVPQYINPYWDEEEKKRAIKKYHGEQSVSYRIFVRGEVVTEGISVFDMERVRKCYTKERLLKSFELSKEHFSMFKGKLIVERPKNAEEIYITADIGESAPTEISIFSLVNGKYKYLYNITLYKLTDKEQFEIFDYLISILNAEHTGIDTTDGTGRAIYRRLAEKYPPEKLAWVAFNERIPVGFKKDEEGRVVYTKDGLPEYEMEYTASWSVKRLKDLFYGRHLEIPYNSYKLDDQIMSVKAIQGSNRVIYECVSIDGDHAWQSFQVFAIAEWFTRMKKQQPMGEKKFSKVGV